MQNQPANVQSLESILKRVSQGENRFFFKESDNDVKVLQSTYAKDGAEKVDVEKNGMKVFLNKEKVSGPPLTGGAVLEMISVVPDHNGERKPVINLGEGYACAPRSILWNEDTKVLKYVALNNRYMVIGVTRDQGSLLFMSTGCASLSGTKNHRSDFENMDDLFEDAFSGIAFPEEENVTLYFAVSLRKNTKAKYLFTETMVDIPEETSGVDIAKKIRESRFVDSSWESLFPSDAQGHHAAVMREIYNCTYTDYEYMYLVLQTGQEVMMVKVYSGKHDYWSSLVNENEKSAIVPSTPDTKGQIHRSLHKDAECMCITKLPFEEALTRYLEHGEKIEFEQLVRENALQEDGKPDNYVLVRSKLSGLLSCCAEEDLNNLVTECLEVINKYESYVDKGLKLRNSVVGHHYRGAIEHKFGEVNQKPELSNICWAVASLLMEAERKWSQVTQNGLYGTTAWANLQYRSDVQCLLKKYRSNVYNIYYHVVNKELEYIERNVRDPLPEQRNINDGEGDHMILARTLSRDSGLIQNRNRDRGGRGYRGRGSRGGRGYRGRGGQ